MFLTLWFDSSLHVEPVAWSRTPDNENLLPLSKGSTPAETLQWVRREKELMRKELAADFRLRSDERHRISWENLEGLERCVMQRYYPER